MSTAVNDKLIKAAVGLLRMVTIQYIRKKEYLYLVVSLGKKI